MGERIITRGVEYPIAWRFKLDANTPKPLTGYKVLIQMRAHDRADEVIKQWTELDPEVTFTPLTGAVDLLMKPSTTLAFTFKTCVLDCWVYDGVADTDGDRTPLEHITLNWGSSRL